MAGVMKLVLDDSSVIDGYKEEVCLTARMGRPSDTWFLRRKSSGP